MERAVIRRSESLSLQSVAAMLLLVVLWGLSIPATKLGLLTLPPLTLTALRFAIAAPLLFIFAARALKMPRRALPRAAALGLLGISVGQVAQAFGVEGATASVGTVISATIPVFVVLFAALRLGQHVARRQQMGLLAAFVGIAVVAFGQEGPDPSAALQSSVWGVAWMLLSALTIAFYYVWSVELTADYGVASVAAWSTLFGFIALLPFAAWEMRQVPFDVTAQGLAVAAYLGVAVTVVGLFLWLYLLRAVPARVAASVQYLQPVVGIIAASIMFGDRLGPMFGLGVILILAGLALAVASERAPEEAAPQE